METILKSLTLEQAQTWFSLTDKFVYIDDNILEPAGLRATDARVYAIEDEFMNILAMAEIDGMRL